MSTLTVIVWKDDRPPSEEHVSARAENPTLAVRLVHFSDYTKCISDMASLTDCTDQLFCTAGTPPTLRYNLGAVLL